MSHFGDLLAGKGDGSPKVSVSVPEPVAAAPEKPKRARNGKGHYVADDPSTPENEAWVGGIAPGGGGGAAG